MDFKELIELRNRAYDLMIMNYETSISVQLRKRDETINDYIKAGRIYYNNHTLNFQELESLCQKEMRITTQKTYLKNFRKLLKLRGKIKYINEFDFCGKRLTPEDRHRNSENAKKEFLEEGRKYYNDNTLTLNALDELILTEMKDSQPIRTIDFDELIEIKNSMGQYDYSTPELEELSEQVKIGMYLDCGRAYYRMPNLTLEDLNELIHQELQDKLVKAKN